MKEFGRSDLVKIEKVNERISWVDVLKFIGIYFIYIGHFGQDAGIFYKYAFQFHVPLFFFVSGFFFKNNNEENFINFVKKRINRYIVPYFVFNILYIIIYCIAKEFGINFICNELFKSLLGIRNNLLAGSTWFIPCLFMMEIIYYFLNKILKQKKMLLLTVSLLIYVYLIYFSSNNPIINPSLFWNIDSALVYMVYFSLGNILFKYIKNYKNCLQGKRKFITYPFIMFVFFISIICLFKGRTFFGKFLIGKYYFLYDILFTIILIIGNVVISILLKDITLFQSIGKETLYLCLTENLIRILTSNIFIFFGINISISNPLIALIYSFCLLYFNYKYFIPLIKKVKLRCNYESGSNKCSL